MVPFVARMGGGRPAVSCGTAFRNVPLLRSRNGLRHFQICETETNLAVERCRPGAQPIAALISAQGVEEKRQLGNPVIRFAPTRRESTPETLVLRWIRW
jgi:hypothetical protein